MDTQTTKPNPLIQKGSFNSINWKKVIVAVIFLFLFGSAAFYIGHKYPVRIIDNTSGNNLQNSNTVASPTSSNTGWKMYNNNKYHYSFSYPADWTIETTFANEALVTPSYTDCSKSISGGSTVTLSGPSQSGEGEGYLTFRYGASEQCWVTNNYVQKTTDLTILNQPFVEANTTLGSGPEYANYVDETYYVPKSLYLNSSNNITGYFTYNGKGMIIGYEDPLGIEDTIDNVQLQSDLSIISKILESLVITN